MGVKKELTELIENQISVLEGLKPGTDEYISASETLAKLLDQLNKIQSTENEYWEKQQSRAEELDLKQKQYKSERTDRIVKNGLTVFSIGSGIVLAVWGTLVTLNFEKTGSVTTMAGRKFFDYLIPKKWS